jgi:hypothetical protein
MAPLGILPHPHSVRVTGPVQPYGDLPTESVIVPKIIGAA